MQHKSHSRHVVREDEILVSVVCLNRNTKTKITILSVTFCFKCSQRCNFGGVSIHFFEKKLMSEGDLKPLDHLDAFFEKLIGVS